MDFEIAVVGVGLAGKQRFQFAPADLSAQTTERGFGLRHRLLVAFLFAKLKQRELIVELLLNPADRRELIFERIALAHQALGARLIVPKIGIFGFLVQLGETPLRGIDVKDASSAARATA
jgi:hypothetical protein